MEVLYNVKDGELENASSYEIACAAVKVLDSKKASDLKLLKIDSKTTIADYFVICSGNSSTQIKTLSDEVEYQLEKIEIKADRVEGRGSDNSWMVMDYGRVIVHIFSREMREFYNLDKLYSDTEKITVED